MILYKLSIKYAASAHKTLASSYKKDSDLQNARAGLLRWPALLTIAVGLAVSQPPADAAWRSAYEGAYEGAPASTKIRRQSGVIIRVVDGDTVWLAPSAGGKRLKVRMTGIDAPEICQAGGIAAREALAGRVLGKAVVIAIPKSRSRDDYGRVLASVELNGEDVGRWMVRSGQAWSYGYKRQSGFYAGEQILAIKARRGLFADSRAEDPRSFRKRNGSCYLYEHPKSVVLQ